MGTVRVHFTTADLARTSMAAEPDPLWELVLSLHVLQGENPRRSYPEWRRTLPPGWERASLGRVVRDLLAPLAPAGPYFPDFMTPIEAGAGFEAGVEAILRTPRRRVRHELERVRPTPAAAGWIASVADGRAATMSMLGAALRLYFTTALLPHWPTIQARVASEFMVRSQLRVSGGVTGMLASLRPKLVWEPPVLSFAGPRDRDLHLGGRGLTIIPSYFNWVHPIAVYDDDLPPTVLYPVSHRDPVEAAPNGALAELLGATRAAALQAIARGCTTSELAATLGISASTASLHASVLRRAGQITTRRHGHAVWHTLTPLGLALLSTESNAS